jgi:hypothetical protein
VAAVDRPAIASGVAAICGIGVFICGYLPWYGLESTVRAGTTVELTVSLWGDDRGDLLLVLLLAAGVGLAAFNVAIRVTARPTPFAWGLCLAGAVAFLVALLIVITRAGDTPGLSGARYGGTLAVVLAVVAAAAAALSARLSRPAARSGAPPGRTWRRS